MLKLFILIGGWLIIFLLWDLWLPDLYERLDSGLLVLLSLLFLWLTVVTAISALTIIQHL